MKIESCHEVFFSTSISKNDSICFLNYVDFNIMIQSIDWRLEASGHLKELNKDADFDFDFWKDLFVVAESKEEPTCTYQIILVINSKYFSH